jgi:predicted SnoaL-like aldol condensation-catalyzing enzyme
MARCGRWLAIVVLLMIGCAALSAQSPNQEAKNQQLVLDWYREVVTFGHVELAPKYMADTFIEHDPEITGGLKEFVAAYGKAHPRPIQRRLPIMPLTFTQGDYVVMVWERPDNDARTGTPYTYFTYDVVRVKDGKIQEHWNSIRRAGPAGTPVEPQQQSGEYAIPDVPMKHGYDVSSIKYTPQEMKDIEVAIGYYRDVVQSHHHELADKYLAKDEIQHNPVDPTTAEGLIAWFNSRNPTPDPLHKEITPLPDLLLAKDGMVLMMYDRQERLSQDASKIITTSRFEMVRIENGKVKEHWDTADRKSSTIAPVLDWCLKSGRRDCPKP